MSQRFISESDIAAKKKQLKEAWDATKGEDDPENPPDEPPPDNRPLYHRLEEQKNKKQEEYDDAHKLKNMVRGLEDEEVQFLDLVDQTKMEQERRVRDEENTALSEFRKRRVEMEIARSSEMVSTVSHSTSTPSTTKTVKNSQKQLLSGAIKRRGDPTEQRTDPSKRPRLSSDDGDSKPSSNGSTEQVLSNGTPQTRGNGDPNDCFTSTITTAGSKPSSGASSTAAPVGPNGYLVLAGRLPGIGPYSDSSNSEDSSDESDPDTRTRFVIRNKNKAKKGCC